MGEGDKLSVKQSAVLRDLFGGELDEQAVIDKHKVSRRAYTAWLAQECFSRQFDANLSAMRRQSELIIARCASLAALKLAQLTESAKEETARKACLDILSLPNVLSGRDTAHTGEQEGGDEPERLSPALTSRLLAALAEDAGE